MPIKCPHCGADLSREEVSALISQAVDEGLAPSFAGRRKGSRNSRPRSDIGKSHRPPTERKPEAESELKKRTSAENGRKGGRPKGSPNKAPRADKGLSRGPRNSNR
jgi:hypothetical protein